MLSFESICDDMNVDVEIERHCYQILLRMTADTKNSWWKKLANVNSFVSSQIKSKYGILIASDSTDRGIMPTNNIHVSVSRNGNSNGNSNGNGNASSGRYASHNATLFVNKSNSSMHVQNTPSTLSTQASQAIINVVKDDKPTYLFPKKLKTHDLMSLMSPPEVKKPSTSVSSSYFAPAAHSTRYRLNNDSISNASNVSISGGSQSQYKTPSFLRHSRDGDRSRGVLGAGSALSVRTEVDNEEMFELAGLLNHSKVESTVASGRSTNTTTNPTSATNHTTRLPMGVDMGLGMDMNLNIGRSGNDNDDNNPDAVSTDYIPTQFQSQSGKLSPSDLTSASTPASESVSATPNGIPIPRKDSTSPVLGLGPGPGLGSTENLGLDFNTPGTTGHTGDTGDTGSIGNTGIIGNIDGTAPNHGGLGLELNSTTGNTTTTTNAHTYAIDQSVDDFNVKSAVKLLFLFQKFISAQVIDHGASRVTFDEFYSPCSSPTGDSTVDGTVDEGFMEMQKEDA